MPSDKQRVSLAPLLGVNSRRVSDRQLGGTFMRGGFNFELRDGEWWTRAGETDLGGTKRRYGSCPWWWIQDINKDLTIIANPWWALALTSSATVTELYTAAITENVALTNGSANATSSTTRVVDQLILVGASDTSEVYRVKSRVGTAMVLDRPYEGSTGAAKSCRFIDPLPRNTAGTATAYDGSFGVNGAWKIQGSCVVFEQLTTHAAADLYAASPALTGGNLHLVITSNMGTPVAIDLSAYLAGSTVGVRRSWFYNTSLGSSAAAIGSDSQSDQMYPRGVFAEVYKDRLFIAAASDPDGKYGSRTVWWSHIGDLGRWHVGIPGQTAAGSFKTFSGEGNAIAEMKVLQDSLVVHRQDSQEVGNPTQSDVNPITFDSNNQGIGVRGYYQTNRVVTANGVQFIWTPEGPAVFDLRSVTLICEDAREALAALFFIRSPETISHVGHDAVRRRIYWFLGDPGTTRRHQDALPATAAVTLLSGEQVQNYCSCFVYDYANNACWFEDRPMSLGNGVFTDSSNEGPVLHLSRPDGTIVKLLADSSTGMDPDMLAPNTSASDYSVFCQAETPWLDLGSLTWKQLTEVSVDVRCAERGGDIYDDGVSLSTLTYGWLRMRVFTELDRATQRSGVGAAYTLANTQLATVVDYRQSPEGALIFSPNVSGRRFKLVFSNQLTAAAQSAGYSVVPVRISDIECEYATKQSTIPLTILNVGANLVE
jgi:hypothetical protein